MQEIEYPHDPSILAEADLETLRRLMTAHLRMERYAVGHLQGLFASGYMRRFCDRLREVSKGN